MLCLGWVNMGLPQNCFYAQSGCVIRKLTLACSLGRLLCEYDLGVTDSKTAHLLTPVRRNYGRLFHIIRTHLSRKLNILGYSTLTAFSYPLGCEHQGAQHSPRHCKKDKVHI